MKIHNWKNTLGILLIALLFSACNDNNHDPAPNALQQLAASDANADSSEILDPAGLEQTLRDTFGQPDDEPVAVNSGDTLATIISRQNSQ